MCFFHSGISGTATPIPRMLDASCLPSSVRENIKPQCNFSQDVRWVRMGSQSQSNNDYKCTSYKCYLNSSCQNSSSDNQSQIMVSKTSTNSRDTTQSWGILRTVIYHYKYKYNDLPSGMGSIQFLLTPTGTESTSDSLCSCFISRRSFCRAVCIMADWESDPSGFCERQKS